MLIGVCVHETTEMNENGHELDAVYVSCVRCGHESETSFTSQHDDGSASVRRCILLLRQTCPRRESNFYVKATAKNACRC